MKIKKMKKMHLGLLPILIGWLTVCSMANAGYNRKVTIINWTDQDIMVRTICDDCGEDTDPAKVPAKSMYNVLATNGGIRDSRFHIDIEGLHLFDKSGNLEKKSKKQQYWPEKFIQNMPIIPCTCVIWFDKSTKQLKITDQKEWNLGKSAIGTKEPSPGIPENQTASNQSSISLEERRLEEEEKEAAESEAKTRLKFEKECWDALHPSWYRSIDWKGGSRAIALLAIIGILIYENQQLNHQLRRALLQNVAHERGLGPDVRNLMGAFLG